MNERLKKARKEAEKRHVDEVARHIFICTGPDCISPKEGDKLWSYLKKRVADEKERCPEGYIYRTKVGCLRICESGPVGVVYPDAVWYGRLDRAGIDRVVKEHLLEGKPVEDLAIGHGLRPYTSPNGD